MHDEDKRIINMFAIYGYSDYVIQSLFEWGTFLLVAI